MSARLIRFTLSALMLAALISMPAVAAPVMVGDLINEFPMMGSYNPSDNPNPQYFRLVLKEDSWVSIESYMVDRPYTLGLNWKLADNDGVDTWMAGIMYWQDMNGKWSYGSTQGISVDAKSGYKGVFVLSKGEYFLRANTTGITNYMFLASYDKLFTAADKEPNDKKADAMSLETGTVMTGRLLGGNGAEYEKQASSGDYVDFYLIEVKEAGIYDFKCVSDGFFTGDLYMTDLDGSNLSVINVKGAAHESMKSNAGFEKILLEDASNTVSQRVEIKQPGKYYVEVRMSFPGTYKFSLMNEAQAAAAQAGLAQSEGTVAPDGKLIAESGNLKVYYSNGSVTITGLDPDTTYMLNLMPTDIFSMTKAGSLSLTVGGFDDWEPNNDIENATKEAFPEAFGTAYRASKTISGKISGPEDRDYFAFSVKDFGMVKINLTAVGLDAEIELLDENGDSILKATKRVGRDNVSINYDLEPGKYYLLVGVSKEPASKDYSIDIKWEE